MQQTIAHRLITRVPTPLVLAGMALGALLIYRTVSLPIIAIGLVIFGLLALLRPTLGLLCMPIVAPWYLSPVYVPNVRAAGTVFPLLEVLLLVVLAAALGNWLLERLLHPRQSATARPVGITLAEFLPHGLFLLAGVLGILIAIERGPALRDFRWMVVEPLIFYGLLRWLYRREANYLRMIAVSLVASGTFVAVLGLLQAVGVNLVPLFLSPTKSFADSVVEAGNASRVASVYGHPNNLGMFLGRVWPLAAVLAAAGGWRLAAGDAPNPLARRFSTGNFTAASITYAMCAVVLLAGLFVSFSRGAWLGAVAALAVLAVGWLSVRGHGSGAGGQRPDTSLAQERQSGSIVASVAGVAALMVVGGLVFSLRGGVAGGSADARLLFWRESLQLIARHPFGLGLDQFYYYHNPDFGRSLIDPSLIGTSEQYAKHPHNLFFELWLLLTPLGLFAFVWLLVRCFRRGLHIFRAAPHSAHGVMALGAMAALAAALTHGLVDTFYFWPDIALTFWLLVGLIDTMFVDITANAVEKRTGF